MDNFPYHMRQYNNNYTIHDFVLQVPNEKKSWISERCEDNEEIGAESACKTASKVKCMCYQGQGKGFRKSTEGRAIWSSSAEDEIRSQAVKMIKTLAD